MNEQTREEYESRFPIALPEHMIALVRIMHTCGHEAHFGVSAHMAMWDFLAKHFNLDLTKYNHTLNIAANPRIEFSGELSDDKSAGTPNLLRELFG